MKGLLLNNEIVDVSASEFPVHASMTWIDVPDDCEAGWTVVDGIPTPPTPPSAEEQMRDLRLARTTKLRKSDWTQFPDVPESTRLAWQPYRQALRDITENYSSIDDVVWPTKPE